MSGFEYLAETLRACAEIADNPQLGTPMRDLFGLGDFPDFEYTDVFVLEIVPDAAIFLSEEAVLGGEVQERIVGFHRALGIEQVDDPTGLVGQLRNYASLLESVQENLAEPSRLAILNRVRSTYLLEHILVWLPTYLSYVESLFPKLTSWSQAILDVFATETKELGILEWNLEPSALANRPNLRDVGGKYGLEVFAAPYITGFIVSKTLLRTLGQKYNVAPRLGTRKFMLSSMFQQDASAMLELLTEAATMQMERWSALEADFGLPLKSWRINAGIAIEEIQSGRSALLAGS